MQFGLLAARERQQEHVARSFVFAHVGPRQTPLPVAKPTLFEMTERTEPQELAGTPADQYGWLVAAVCRPTCCADLPSLEVVGYHQRSAGNCS